MRTKKDISGKALKALSALALTLPGIQEAHSEAQIIKPKTDFRYTRYDEGTDRYKIDVYQAQLGIALGAKADLTVKASKDVMSGASPVFTEPANLINPNASPANLVELRSSPTIKDERNIGDINLRFFGDDYNIGFGVGVSQENDYESQTYHTQLTNEFNKGNTVLTSGYSFSNDTVRPEPFRLANIIPLERLTRRTKKVTHQFSMSLKQDLSITALIQGIVQFIADKGYLSDPYKAIFIYGNPNRSGSSPVPPIPQFGNPFPDFITYDHDKRPDYRGTLAGSLLYVQHISPLKSSLHLGYRFVKNTWNIRSHTLSADYYHPLGEAWEVIPSLRYYTQGDAYFYAMAFDALGTAPFPAKSIDSTSSASSDYRLAKFGSITAEIKFQYKFMADQSGKLTLSFGVIDRKNQYYWGRKPNPANPSNNFKTHYGSLGVSFVF